MFTYPIGCLVTLSDNIVMLVVLQPLSTKKPSISFLSAEKWIFLTNTLLLSRSSSGFEGPSSFCYYSDYFSRLDVYY